MMLFSVFSEIGCYIPLSCNVILCVLFVSHPQRVLTTELIEDGVKITDVKKMKEKGFSLQKVCDATVLD